MHKTNLDFLLTDVPSVLDFLDKVDSSKTGAEAYYQDRVQEHMKQQS